MMSRAARLSVAAFARPLGHSAEPTAAQAAPPLLGAIWARARSYLFGLGPILLGAVLSLVVPVH